MEVLVLLYLFDYYYLAVGGRYDQPLGVLAAEVAYRTSEELRMMAYMEPKMTRNDQKGILVSNERCNISATAAMKMKP